MPRFSLIIPVYNLAEYITDCLASIEAQSFQDYEVIVIDDGSKDDSFEICNRWGITHPLVRTIRQEHSGVSSARNNGLRRARGEYIWFIDGDDYIHPNALEALNAIIEAHPKLDYVQHNYHYTHTRFHNFQFKDISDASSEFRVVSSKEDFSKLLTYAPIAICNTCCRRKLLKGLVFERIRTSEDRLFALNMVYRAQSAVFISECIYNVYLRPDSFTRQPYNREAFSDYIRFVNYSFALKGQRNGWGDDVLCFFNERSNMPQLMKKIGCLKERDVKKWAWQSLLAIIQKHCRLFHGREAFYVRWINKTHCYLLAWLFLRFRYILRDFFLRHKRLYALYMRCKHIMI